MSEPTIGVRALGKVLLILGLCAMAATALPYGYGWYQRMHGKKTAEASQRDLHRIFEDEGYGLYQQELWFPARQQRSDNPEWVKLRRAITAYECAAEELKDRKAAAEDELGAGHRKTEKFQTPAALSAALALAGLIVFGFGWPERP